MAKNIQADNATRLMWRNNNAECVVSNGLTNQERHVNYRNYSDLGTYYTQLGMLGTTANSYRIDVPNNSNINIGRIRATGYATWSSRRFKENIKQINTGLDIVMQLKPSTFNWKPENGGVEDASFIAEELQEVLPLAVFCGDDGQPSSIDATRIIPYLVSAVQTQQSTIKALTKRIEALEARG
jgi:hypothetical protein